MASIIAIASIVLGLLGFVVFPRETGIAAIVCGVVAAALGKRTGVAGIVLGVFDLVMPFLLS